MPWDYAGTEGQGKDRDHLPEARRKVPEENVRLDLSVITQAATALGKKPAFSVPLGLSPILTYDLDVVAPMELHRAEQI